MTVGIDQISEQIREAVYAMWLLAALEPNAEIAAAMKQQVDTVDRHVAALKARLSLTARVQHLNFAARVRS